MALETHHFTVILHSLATYLRKKTLANTFVVLQINSYQLLEYTSSF